MHTLKLNLKHEEPQTPWNKAFLPNIHWGTELFVFCVICDTQIAALFDWLAASPRRFTFGFCDHSVAHNPSNTFHLRFSLSSLAFGILWSIFESIPLPRDIHLFITVALISHKSWVNWTWLWNLFQDYVSNIFSQFYVLLRSYLSDKFFWSNIWWA